MSILVHVTSPFVGAQLDALRRLAPEQTICTDDDACDAGAVEAILAFRLPPGVVERYPRLRFVAAAGAGVDEMLASTTLPEHVPVTRAHDPMQAVRMAQYVALCVLRWHRELPRFERQQARREWQRVASERESAWTVGLMGYGALGRAVAASLASFGYPLRIWTRTRHDVSGIASFAGPGELAAFASGTRVLVCLLPLTAATKRLVSRALLDALPRGAYVVNVSRGAIVDEAALIAGLDAGHIAGASLDVFQQEPLPPESPLWRDARILVTPHIAAMPDPETAARQLLDNLARARRGEPLLHTVDRSRGY